MKALPALLVVVALAVGVTLYLTQRTDNSPRADSPPEAGATHGSAASPDAPTNLAQPGTLPRDTASAPAGVDRRAPEPLPEPWMEELRDLDRDQLVQQLQKYQAQADAELERLADEKVANRESQWVTAPAGEEPKSVAARLAPPGKVAVARPGPVTKGSSTADFELIVLDPSEHDELRLALTRARWIEEWMARPPR
jgi:hypothetical protein